MLQAVLRDQETDAALFEAQIRNMELQLQKKLFEQVCSIFIELHMFHKLAIAITENAICAGL